MTRREQIVECLHGIEEGQEKLQAHIQIYGITGHSRLLFWLCKGIRLILEKELK